MRGKPIVCNESDKTDQAAEACRLSVANGASYGLILKLHNRQQPFLVTVKSPSRSVRRGRWRNTGISRFFAVRIAFHQLVKLQGDHVLIKRVRILVFHFLQTIGI
jgi:hypothetical protein